MTNLPNLIRNKNPILTERFGDISSFYPEFWLEWVDLIKSNALPRNDLGSTPYFTPGTAIEATTLKIFADRPYIE